ncbi:MAG: hypothetical protein IJ037_10005, partial [Clostridia bacterium]|nr:hypothetical protein [Clostridia bacterium]MBQ8370450.1 hypothetical protein [Clostridia bacterium]MBQ8513329.1 hypothetical protein [Clostridia bacterium]
SLGISAASVSQWECGKTAPDISQLPILANIFEVTTDHLLGVDVDSKEQEIQRIVKKAYEHSSSGHRDLALPILEEGLRRFPTSHKLMLDLSSAYYVCTRDFPLDEETRDHYRREVIRLCTKIRTESTNDRLRNGATQILCYAYEQLGMKDEILRLAEGQASLFTNYHDFMVRAHTGTIKYRYVQQYIITELADFLHTIRRVRTTLDDGSPAYSGEEEIEIRKKILAICDIVIEDGNYGFFRDRVISQHSALAKCYSESGDAENALHHLEQAAHHAIIYDTEYDPNALYTSLLLRGTPFGGVAHNSTENACLSLLNHMAQSCFDFIRDDARFTAITGQLSPHAAER